MDTKIPFYKKTRLWLYNIVTPSQGNWIGAVYDIIIATIAIFSIIPLLIGPDTTNDFVKFINDYNWIWLSIFILDYILRWSVADLIVKKGSKSFLIFPFTFWGFVDLLAILGGVLGSIFSSHILRILQAFIAFRLFRLVVLFPKVHEGVRFVFRSLFREWKILLIILITLFAVTFLGAIFIYNVEYGQNQSIQDFGDALWFVFITITTIGYGDTYVTTAAGRVLTAIFALLGISIIALVTATVVSGFSKELNEYRDFQRKISDNLSKDIIETETNENFLKLLKEKYTIEQLKEYEDNLHIIIKHLEYKNKKEEEFNEIMKHSRKKKEAKEKARLEAEEKAKIKAEEEKAKIEAEKEKQVEIEDNIAKDNKDIEKDDNSNKK